MHPTTSKGDLGVLKVMADLIKKEIEVFTPLSASAAFDLLILHRGIYKKVQIKYREIYKNVIKVDLLRHTGKKIYAANEEIDILAIYCPNNDRCYYIDNPPKHVSLRLNKAANNQKSKIRFADDYLNLK